MDNITNSLFFKLALNGYFPVSISLNHSYYIHFTGKAFSKKKKFPQIYYGYIYELKGDSFDPVLLVTILFSSRCIRLSTAEFSVTDLEHLPYQIYENCPCLFLPCTNYKKFIHFLKLALSSLLIKKLI